MDRRCRSAASWPTSCRTSSPARSSCGAGKVGTRGRRRSRASDVPFQLSQRADFFEEEVGLETTLKRPIVNTRDEPHADAQKYRRLHVIVGDANLSEVATFLKVGTTALVLCDDRGRVAAPGLRARLARCGRSAGSATTCRFAEPIALAGGGTVTALEVQWELFDRARKYAERRHGLECVGEDVGRARCSAPLGVGAHRPGVRPGSAWPTRSTGWPSTASSTATASATTSGGATPA